MNGGLAKNNAGPWIYTHAKPIGKLNDQTIGRT